jgi:hypothetical protein
MRSWAHPKGIHGVLAIAFLNGGPRKGISGAMTEPSSRKLAGIALILLLILAWASFVASLAPVVGKWPVLLQAPYYLFMGVAWVIPLKPLIRWVETGSFRNG